MSVLVAALASCTFGGDDDFDYGEKLLKEGEFAPDFALFTDENPDGMMLSGLRGSYVLLEFWRSTCGDCRDATPAMKRIYDTYARADLSLWACLSMPTRPSGVRISRRTPQWMQHREQSAASESAVAAAYHIDWTPTFYLVDPQGRISFATVTSARWKKG